MTLFSFTSQSVQYVVVVKQHGMHIIEAESLKITRTKREIYKVALIFLAYQHPREKVLTIRQEAQFKLFPLTLSKFIHPCKNVATMHDVGEYDDMLYGGSSLPPEMRAECSNTLYIYVS